MNNGKGMNKNNSEDYGERHTLVLHTKDTYLIKVHNKFKHL